jgi:hypothetical protein
MTTAPQTTSVQRTDPEESALAPTLAVVNGVHAAQEADSSPVQSEAPPTNLLAQREPLAVATPAQVELSQPAAVAVKPIQGQPKRPLAQASEPPQVERKTARIVQRQTTNAATSTQQTSAANAQAEQTTLAAPVPLNTDELARQVYAQLRRRLAVERERLR